MELIDPGTVPVLFKGGDTHEVLFPSDSEYRVPDLDRDSGLDDRYRRVLDLPVLTMALSGPAREGRYLTLILRMSPMLIKPGIWFPWVPD